jgi:hypothetical protein
MTEVLLDSAGSGASGSPTKQILCLGKDPGLVQLWAAATVHAAKVELGSQKHERF